MVSNQLLNSYITTFKLIVTDKDQLIFQLLSKVKILTFLSESPSVALAMLDRG